MAKRGEYFIQDDLNAVSYTSAAGRNTEKIIESDLQILKSEGKISGFSKTKKDDDMRGIDFFIFNLEDIKIPLQVKTRISHQKTHTQKHPDIPSISVTHTYPEQRKKQLMQIVEAYPKGECLHLTLNIKKPLVSTKTNVEQRKHIG